jgi:hypothetical protein
MIKPPACSNHIPAQPGWFAVFAVDLPNGDISLDREPVVAWRLETFEIQAPRGMPGDRFDAVTPILAGGSISDATEYVLQFGSAYFTGDERFDNKEDVIAYFRKQRA